MIKKINVIIAIVAMVLIMLVPARYSFAADEEILTMEATQSGGKISVSGKTIDGILAVAINIYSEDGSTFIKMKTSSVNDNNEYSDSIEVPEGNYLVRVADYDGGDYKEQVVKVDSNEEEEEKAEETTDESKEGKSVTNSPKTGDIIAMYLGIIAISGAILFIAVRKRNKSIRGKRSNK